MNIEIVEDHPDGRFIAYYHPVWDVRITYFGGDYWYLETRYDGWGISPADAVKNIKLWKDYKGGDDDKEHSNSNDSDTSDGGKHIKNRSTGAEKRG